MDKDNQTVINPESIKALALDLDGTTLRPDSVLSDRTLAALDACKNRGIGIVVATGRSPESAERFRSVMGAEGPMVYYNGAEVIRMPGFDILASTLLELDVADFCIDLSRKKNVYFHIFLPRLGNDPRERLLAENSSKESDFYKNRSGLDIEFCDLKKAIAVPEITGCIKGMFIAEPPVLDEIYAILEQKYGSEIYQTRSYTLYLEVMARGVSKGSGLAEALKFRGIKPEEAIAFGDEDNDLPMFRTAGFSAAPANAKESVRKAADITIKSNAEDGVAEFLEDLFSL
ncbi:Cof-type HAD-IIB family hydrolase [Breznakiella homolactica]|uniref:HAD family phosphatase n=1 Tax=Breznakiella homolactica TaxID=2798577 RepID=A0A7T8BAC8_9SPIR|nr:Cof-type HAD-IIB family hydrolase [Breznakiella homolactica]QQO09392.1 Cof-type HAD-IIB family hydrolase [Breznakiella homolactica]